MIRKGIAELIGTALLVIFGCGTAVAANKYVTSIYGVAWPFTMILVALAFGLILVALVYTIGKVSGAHVNPAVSVACLINGRISVLECIAYVICQVVGSIIGAMVLWLVFGSNTSLGANGFDSASMLTGTPATWQMAFIIEMILTFVFVLVVLATTKKENENAGIIIGLTLTLVHIFGLPFTGTSVNPARSIGPALITGGTAIEQLWLFIIAPLVGAILAALFYKYIIDASEKPLVLYSEEGSEEYEEEYEEETEIEDEDEDLEEDDEEEIDEDEEDDESEEETEDEDEEEVEEVKPKRSSKSKKTKSKK